MKEITTYTENNQTVISARDLSNELGLLDKNFQRWFEIQTSYFVENEEFGVLLLKEEALSKAFRASSNKKDYWLTLDTAKHIALMSRTEKGKEYRTRLIQLEKENTKPMSQLTTLELCDLIRSTELARLAEVEKYENLNIEFLNVMEEEGFYQFITVSKLLAKTGLGRTTLMAILREKGILLNSNLPAQTQVDNGRFVVKRYYLEEVEKHCTTTLVTEKGFVFLATLFHDWTKPIEIPKPPQVLKLTNGCDNIQDWFAQGWTEELLIKEGYAK